MVSETLLNLGRIHWYLLYAASQMEAKCFEPHPAGEFHPVVRTSFGVEVGNDEAHWWVYKQEHDIPMLKKKTIIALDAVSNLYHTAEEIRSAYLPSVNLLWQEYEALAIKHKNDIEIILDYVKWLYSKDILAPTILFNSRTWSSSSMSDRIIPVKKGDLKEKVAIEKLTLIVLGAINMGWATIDKIRAEMQVNAFYDHNTTGLPPKNESNVSEELVESKTANQATHIFENYMEHLRYSLRGLKTEIENRESQERVVTSDDFWRSFIRKAAHSKKTEQKYWDFKETLDMWHQENKPQRDERANKFTEIVSGFGNNQGGVIIVGVTNVIPRKIVGLGGTPTEIENRMKTIPHVIKQYISYDKNFFYLHQVNVPDQNGDMKLCLVIAIKQTCDVLSVKNLDNKNFSCPFREETGTVYKDWNFIRNHKISVKSDNYDFINVLQQFVNEEM